VGSLRQRLDSHIGHLGRGLISTRPTKRSQPDHGPPTMINYILLVSRQGMRIPNTYTLYARNPSITGKVRLAKWFTTIPPKAKGKIVKDVTQLVLGRRTRMCNFLEYKGLFEACPFCGFIDSSCYRHQSRVPPLCVPLLRMRYRICRQ